VVTGGQQGNATSDQPTVRSGSVVGYIRSHKCGDPKLDEWEAEIRSYADEHGYSLVVVLREEGVSGVSACRPVLEKLLHYLENGDYAGVIIPYLAHFGVGVIATRIFNRISEIAWIECVS
jgi:hypothetical protein